MYYVSRLASCITSSCGIALFYFGFVMFWLSFVGLGLGVWESHENLAILALPWIEPTLLCFKLGLVKCTSHPFLSYTIIWNNWSDCYPFKVIPLLLGIGYDYMINPFETMGCCSFWFSGFRGSRNIVGVLASWMRFIKEMCLMSYASAHIWTIWYFAIFMVNFLLLSLFN